MYRFRFMGRSGEEHCPPEFAAVPLKVDTIGWLVITPRDISPLAPDYFVKCPCYGGTIIIESID